MDLKQLRLKQLDQSLAPLRNLSAPAPARGWIHSIRTALGISIRQMAARLGVTHPSYVEQETNERKGTITLNHLRRIAHALDCELIYAVVPRRSLAEMVNQRATEIARQRVSRVAHTMALEDQGTAPDVVEAQVSTVKSELLSGRWSRLWQ